MSDQPGLLRRFDRSGLPLLLVRLTLGVLFVAMGMAKTGLLKQARAGEGPLAFAPVQRFIAWDLVEPTTPANFMKVIHEYRMVPDSAWWVLNLTAAVLPWTEVLCGILLILGVAVRGSAMMLLAMLLFFTPLVAMRAWEEYAGGGIAFCDIAFDCGCGAGEVRICPKLLENGTLILLTLYALFSGSRRFALIPRLVPGRRA